MTRLAAAALVALMAAAGCAASGGGESPSHCPSTLASARAPVVPAEVVERFPHDPQAFTQGLVVESATLYESTGRFGESSVRVVDLETGNVERRVDLAEDHFGEGLTLLDGLLYQVTWRNGIGFVYRAEDLEQVDTFQYDGEGWGLTTDGSQLILSNGSEVLTFLDPDSYEVARTLEVTDAGDPVDELNELEWIDGEIWANVWRSDRVARIDPQTGDVLGWLDLAHLYPANERGEEGAVPNGIAYDDENDRLFVTGKLWPTLFEIELAALPTPRCD